MKKVMSIVALFAAVVMATTLSAQPTNIQDWLWNFNVWNNTGQTANDFEVALCGTNSLEINHVYTGSYPNYSIANSGGCEIITWTGNTTPNGGSAHFGVEVNYAAVSSVALNWTLNGAPIGPPVQSVQNDYGMIYDVPFETVTNPGPSPVWVSVATVAVTNQLQLTDLTTNSTLYSSATFGPTNYLGYAGFQWYNFIAPGVFRSLGVIIKQFSDNSGTPGPEQLVDFSFLNFSSPVTVPQPTLATNLTYVQPPRATNGYDVFDDGPWVLGDDFVSTNTGPITNIDLWGSWVNDQVETNSLVFTLAIYNDVPTGGTNLFSHPGQLLWQEQFAPGQYVESYWSPGQEKFLDPGPPIFPTASAIMAADSQVWYYSFSPTCAFVERGAPNWPQRYWLMAYALNTNMQVVPFGWKTTFSIANDVSVHAMWAGSMVANYTNNSPNGTNWAPGASWGPTADTNGYPLDLAFKLAAEQGTVNYFQLPKTTNGYDVFDMPPFVLGDDFVCTNTGGLTGIHLWGSWFNDQVGTNSLLFTLGIYNNVPPMGSYTNSHPGNLLWQEQFAPGQYVESYWSPGQEYFLGPTPSGPPPILAGTDSNVWYYSFYPTNVFVEQSSAAAPQTYWLMVNAEPTTTNSGFGWKTTFGVSNDVSVYAANWTGSMAASYTNNSPDPAGWMLNLDTNGNPLDLAFEITTATNYLPSLGSITITSLPPARYVLTWPGGFLQAAMNVSGPYNTLWNATSPWTNFFGPSNVFYRAVCP